MWNGCKQPLNAFAKWSPSNGDQKRRYLLHVRHLRVWREISHLHVFGHALPKGCHKRLLCEMECAASSYSMLSQNGVPRMEIKTERADSESASVYDSCYRNPAKRVSPN